MTPRLPTFLSLQSLRRHHPVFPFWPAAFLWKHHRPPKPGYSRSGFTLVELSVTIGVILVLIGTASLGIKPYLDYRDGRSAGEMLRSVKAAQLMYLSDNPSTPVTSLTPALLLPYMPSGSWPTLPPVGATTPTIKCTVFPPVTVLSGTPYDPSGSNTDGLWDVGAY